MATSGISSGLSPTAILGLINNGSTQSTSGLPALSGGNSSLYALLDSSASPGDSAQISGPGQLYGQLQQLQTQNPTQFKQVTGQIASQLETASTQSTGGQAGFLANLASQFQTAAQTGDATSLQPQAGSGTGVAGTYNSQGQLNQALLTALNPSSGSSSSSGSDFAQLLGGTSSSSTGVDLGQVFANISQEVNQAIGVQS